MCVQGEDIAQSDPDTQHVQQALESLECLIVQDIFDETACTHVIFPGLFLEKDGTFTNAERRQPRAQGAPLAGLGLGGHGAVRRGARLRHAL